MNSIYEDVTAFMWWLFIDVETQQKALLCGSVVICSSAAEAQKI